MCLIVYEIFNIKEKKKREKEAKRIFLIYKARLH